MYEDGEYAERMRIRLEIERRNDEERRERERQNEERRRRERERQNYENRRQYNTQSYSSGGRPNQRRMPLPSGGGGNGSATATGGGIGVLVVLGIIIFVVKKNWWFIVANWVFIATIIGIGMVCANVCNIISRKIKKSGLLRFFVIIVFIGLIGMVIYVGPDKMDKIFIGLQQKITTYLRKP